MPYLPRGLAQPMELRKELDALKPFPPEVVNLRYTVKDDWSGDPAIYFWVTLSDEAADLSCLHDNANMIRDLITERLDPAGKWDLFPYFYFRSESEAATIK